MKDSRFYLLVFILLLILVEISKGPILCVAALVWAWAALSLSVMASYQESKG